MSNLSEEFKKRIRDYCKSKEYLDNLRKINETANEIKKA